jgi:hypothetical protein
MQAMTSKERLRLAVERMDELEAAACLQRLGLPVESSGSAGRRPTFRELLCLPSAERTRLLKRWPADVDKDELAAYEASDDSIRHIDA